MAYFFLYIHVADRNFKTSLNNISYLETILFDCQVIGINKKKPKVCFFYSCNRLDSVRILLKVYNFFLFLCSSHICFSHLVHSIIVEFAYPGLIVLHS